ncbi:VOC family protein [Deinococcus apachensis]|uniref:VOC family protein n=1 Tax=Deinococcus apachensis TaxID=309886 RepID=UPI000360891F|nr:VOC family protein [Deinococcus apachensis]
MRVLRTVPNVPSRDLSQSRRFYGETLGYCVVMDLGWIVTFASPTDPAAQVSVISREPSGLHPNVSVEVDDVDAAHAEMRRQGVEVVYPLRDEPWGVRRFFVRDPGGTVVNVVMHR